MITLAFYLFSTMMLFSGVRVITARNPVHSVLFLIFAFFNAAGLFVILGAEFLAMLLVIVYVGAVAVLFLFVVMMMEINLRNLRRGLTINLKDFISTLSYSLGFILSFGVIGLISIMGLANIITYFFEVLPFDMVKTSVIMMLHAPETLFELPLWSVILKVITLQPFSFPSLAFIGSILLSLWFAIIGAEFIIRRSLREIVQLFTKNFPIAWFIAVIFGAEMILMILIWHDSSVTKSLIGNSTFLSEPSTPNTQALGQMLYTDYMYIFQLSGMILLVAMIGAIVLTLRKREGVRKQNISVQVNRRKEDTLRLKNVPIGKGL